MCGQRPTGSRRGASRPPRRRKLHCAAPPCAGEIRSIALLLLSARNPRRATMMTLSSGLRPRFLFLRRKINFSDAGRRASGRGRKNGGTRLRPNIFSGTATAPLVQITPKQPTMRTDLDIGAKNPVTTTVTGFFIPFFQVKLGRYPKPKTALGRTWTKN